MKKCYIMRGIYSTAVSPSVHASSQVKRGESTQPMTHGRWCLQVQPFSGSRTSPAFNLDFKKSLEEGIPVVVLDNCNVNLGVPARNRDGGKFWLRNRNRDHASLPAIKAFREVNWQNTTHESFMRMYENFENFTFHAPVPSTNNTPEQLLLKKE